MRHYTLCIISSMGFNYAYTVNLVSTIQHCLHHHFDREKKRERKNEKKSFYFFNFHTTRSNNFVAICNMLSYKIGFHTSSKCHSFNIYNINMTFILRVFFFFFLNGVSLSLHSCCHQTENMEFWIDLTLRCVNAFLSIYLTHANFHAIFFSFLKNLNNIHENKQKFRLTIGLFIFQSFFFSLSLDEIEKHTQIYSQIVCSYHSKFIMIFISFIMYYYNKRPLTRNVI